MKSSAERGHLRIDIAARSVLVAWVPVPPDRVFGYVSDISLHPEWAVHPVTVQAVDPGPVHVGSRFTSSGRQGGRQWPSQLEVTIYDPPTRFEFTATGGPIPSPDGNPHRHTFRLISERGGTKIVYERIDPLEHRVTVLVAPIVGRIALRIRRKTMANLVARLESMAAGGY